MANAWINDRTVRSYLTRAITAFLISGCVIAIEVVAAPADDAPPSVAAEPAPDNALADDIEPLQRLPLPFARQRARLLHETVHGALQVMHRDFFKAGQTVKIPSHSLEDVFTELQRSHGVQLRWMAVSTKAMNIDNEPKSAFDLAAVKELKSGRPTYEQLDSDHYQFAGAIRLSASCLACHLSGRTDNNDRLAGLVITIPADLIERPSE